MPVNCAFKSWLLVVSNDTHLRETACARRVRVSHLGYRFLVLSVSSISIKAGRCCHIGHFGKGVGAALLLYHHCCISAANTHAVNMRGDIKAAREIDQRPLTSLIPPEGHRYRRWLEHGDG